MTYLLVNVLIKPGQQSPETREFAPSTWLPQLHEMARALGCGHRPLAPQPRRPSSRWRAARSSGSTCGTRAGATSCGRSVTTRRPPSTRGIAPARTVIVGHVDLRRAGRADERSTRSWASSIACILNFAGGAGYVGIAVALMGRNHPAGIVLAADPVRRAVPGRVGAVVRHADAHARHGRGDPGAHHPRVRRVRARAAPPARRAPADDRAMSESVLLVAARWPPRRVRGATPLVLAALGGLFAERSGVDRHRARGQDAGVGVRRRGHGGGHRLRVGRSRAPASSRRSRWRWSHGFACITHHGNQVVSGMALNITMSGLTAVLGYAWFQRGRPDAAARRRRSLRRPSRCPGVDDARRRAGRRPRSTREVVSGHNVLVSSRGGRRARRGVARSTGRASGLRLRAVGESPGAGRHRGHLGGRPRAIARSSLSGVLCGLAGAYLSIAHHASFIRDMSAGKGYLALAALIFGQWRPRADARRAIRN